MERGHLLHCFVSTVIERMQGSAGRAGFAAKPGGKAELTIAACSAGCYHHRSHHAMRTIHQGAQSAGLSLAFSHRAQRPVDSGSGQEGPACPCVTFCTLNISQGNPAESMILSVRFGRRFIMYIV